MPEAVATLDDVTKRFGAVVALADLTLEVPTGAITVLVGPNGAGKTTALRVITGAMTPDGGRVRVFGLDPGPDGEEVRRRCGVVSAKPALYDRLSGEDNLRYSAELYGAGGDRTRLREAAARFGIEHALDQQVGGYSTGMKTRLALARAILHDPDLLLLDEPTSGLDPESAHAVLALIRELTTDGKSVVLCTHLLLEAEGLADHLVVLQEGRGALSGTVDDLVRRHWDGMPVRLAATDDARLAEVLTARLGHEPARGPDGVAVVEVADLPAVADLVDHLRDAGVRLVRVEPRPPTLEELYFEIRRRSADGDGHEPPPGHPETMPWPQRATTGRPR